MEADRLTYGKTFHQIATGTIQLDEGMMSCGNDRVELIRVAFHDLTGDRPTLSNGGLARLRSSLSSIRPMRRATRQAFRCSTRIT
jgi:hypothetical protein